MTKLTIPRERLLDALSLVSGAVGREGVTSAVLIADGKATTTDLAKRVAVDIGDTDGVRVLLPHRRLVEIARNSPREEFVRIEPKGDSCRITSGRGAWTIPTESPEAFPASAMPEDAQPFAVLAAPDLLAALTAVRVATDTESSRYALGGVLLECDGPSLHAVSTDGRRLLWCRCAAESADGGSLIVPADGVAVLVQVLAGAASVRITRTPGEMVAATDHGVTVAVRLLEGRFPKWRDVVPKGDTAVVAVRKADLEAAVRQAAIVTSEQSKSVSFSFGVDGLTLTARSSEAGEARVRCDLESPGMTARVRLDPRFVIDAIRAAGPDETVTVSAVDSSKPAIIRWGTVLGVVMPMEGDE